MQRDFDSTERNSTFSGGSNDESDALGKASIMESVVRQMNSEIDARIRNADPIYNGAVEPFTESESEEVWNRIASQHPTALGMLRRRRRPVAVAVVGLVAVVVAGVVGILIPARSPKNSAAVELSAIATAVRNKPIARITTGKWFYRRYSVSMTTGPGGGVVSGTLNVYEDKSIACIDGLFGRIHFSSQQAQHAWTSAGLSAVPLGNNPIGFCAATPSTPYSSTHPGAYNGGGVGVINVSGLSTNPTILGRQLNSGTLGASGLQWAVPEDSQAYPGFARVVMLLVEPLVGTTPAFRSALFDALAKIHGVTATGRMVAKSGAVGDAFSIGLHTGKATIIIDPTNGNILQVSNLSSFYNIWGNVFTEAFVPSPNPAVSSLYDGNELLPPMNAVFSPSLQWIDPLMSARAVTASQVPHLQTIVYF